jgi:DNA-binding PadR family transcriptional regulator
MSRITKSPLTYELALLGFLRQGPVHAYEIHRRLRKTSGLRLIWTVKQSQLYALLARLEEEGYVVATVEPQEGRPPRKVLRLTQQGEAAYWRWLSSPVRRPRQFRQEFLARLYWAVEEGPEVVAELVAQQRAACRALVAELQAQAEVVAGETPYEGLVYRLRLAQTQAHLAWLDEVAEALARAEQPAVEPGYAA